VKVTKSRSRSFGSAEKRFAQDDASVGKEQGTGSREQRTENREQGTGNREKRTENGEQGAGNREQGTENREQRTENREQRTENREQRTENREQRTENREALYGFSEIVRAVDSGGTGRGGRQEPTPQAEIQIEFLVNGLFHLIQSDRSRWRSA
jgi:hypothetical protein